MRDNSIARMMERDFHDRQDRRQAFEDGFLHGMFHAFGEAIKAIDDGTVDRNDLTGLYALHDMNALSTSNPDIAKAIARVMPSNCREVRHDT